MKRILKCGVLGVMGLVGVTSSATAETNYYLGGDIIRVADEDFDLDGFTGRIGWNFTDHLGVEGEYTWSTGEDQQGQATFELGKTYSIFGTARNALNENVELFARVGLINSDVDVRTPAGNFTESENSFAAGVGVNLFVTDHLGFRVGYTRAKSDIFGGGVIWRFGRE
ncbi:MAG: porin family protein [Pseudomonadota bacterium]